MPDNMKAVLIDPDTKSVARIDVRPEARLRDYFGEKPRVAAKLPKGDVLFAGVAGGAAAFTIGGSHPIAGPGLIVGRRTGPGERGPAHVRLADVVSMVRWTTFGVPPKPAVTVRAIVVDPEQGIIEEVTIAAHRLALMSLLGGEIGSYMRVPGNDHVLSLMPGAKKPWCWRKDDLTFASRCVIVGRDPETGNFADAVTPVEDLLTSVDFRAPNESFWTSSADRRAQADRPSAA